MPAPNSGIHQIKNQANGKCYIGSATNLRRRWAVHLANLRHKHHLNLHLQAAFDKYGEDRFVFSALEYVLDVDKLIEREQHYFDTLEPEYNIAPTAGSSLGVRHTLETRRKMGEAGRGRHPSPETRRKLSAAKSGRRHPMYGKQHSAEAKRKMREGHKTRPPITPETRAKLSRAKSGERHPFYGKHLSAEHRSKLSEAMAGEQNPFYGRHHSKQTRQKLSQARKGKRHTEETRRKMSESQRARHHKGTILKKEREGCPQSKA